jgi:rhodanese-related sulfurtransferase
MLRLLKQWFAPKPKVNFKELIAGGALVVDVRTPEEYKQGHVKGSVNYPLNALQAYIPIIIEKNKPVITVCRSGARSGMANSTLKKHGVISYNGGPWTNINHFIS